MAKQNGVPVDEQKLDQVAEVADRAARLVALFRGRVAEIKESGEITPDEQLLIDTWKQSIVKWIAEGPETTHPVS